MTELRFSVAALSLLIGSTVSAAPPPPPPPSFTPEVIYRYNGSRAVDLRLANATGTAAVLLHRASSLTGYDLAPASQRTAAFIDTSASLDRLIVRSWSYDPAGAIVVGPPRVLQEAQNLLFADFSPLGDKIVFASYDGTGNLHSIKTVDLAGVTTTVVSGIDGPTWLRWSFDGNSIYYMRQLTSAGVSKWHAFRQPIAGGSPTELFSEPYLRPWDIYRNGSDGLVVGFQRIDSEPLKIGAWGGQAGTPVSEFGGGRGALLGGNPHFSCGNDRLIFKSSVKSGKGYPVKVYDLRTDVETIFSNDQNVPHADFIPCG